MGVPRGLPAAVPRRCRRWRRRDHAGVHGSGRSANDRECCRPARLVRERWRFDGVIVSDHGAVIELIAHGVAGDAAEAAALALRAGVDIDLMSGAYGRGLPIALERGLVTVAQIDAAVRRVLRLKTRLGLFDDPYHRSDAALAPPGQAAMHQELAREAARRSIVLLSNRDGLLPLQDTMRRIAVIGPLADARDDMLGPWAAAGRAEGTVTILEGLRAALPGSEISHTPGVAIDGREAGGIAAALDLARAADVVVLCLGEARRMSGEAASRARPDLPGRQPELARAVLDLGKPVVLLLSSGRPLMAPWLFERAHAVLATWFLGSEAGHAIGDVVSGRHNPAGRLPVSWPVEVGQIPIYYARRPSGRPASRTCTTPASTWIFRWRRCLLWARPVLQPLRAWRSPRQRHGAGRRTGTVGRRRGH